MKDFFNDSTNGFISAIKAKYKSQSKLSMLKPLNIEARQEADVVVEKSTTPPPSQTDNIIVIGASTGGVQALEKLLVTLPKHSPGILIVQHMPAGFTTSFAQRLNSVCNLDVKEAEDGDSILQGKVFLAPGDKHLLIKREEKKFYIQLKDGPKVSRHKPSVDVLFRCAANEAGKNAVGIILTGMGDDGAKGMKEMFDKGSLTIAQNEDSCVVYGMPKEAVE
ncbi:MAG: CheB methylesterase domain-containing protein, partial [Campylobacterales bacterium]|nr:CheB methylesterase domain-containing protein [Campylobacterales bacterium]